MLYYVSFRDCNATCRIGLILAVLMPVITSTAQQTKICTVSNTGRTLAQCLQDPSASDVVLLHDWTLRPVYNQTAPLRIVRNVTVRGPFNVTAANRPVLDSNFLFAPGEICSSCIFTLRDLVLKHDRKGSGPQIDWLTGYSLCSFYLFIQTSKLGYCRQTIVHGVSGKFSNIAD